MLEGSREAPVLARESAKSLPGREECPGIHCKWINLDWDKELRRDCVLDRDLGVKYGRGVERVDRTDRESEKRVIDVKLHVLE